MTCTIFHSLSIYTAPDLRQTASGRTSPGPVIIVLAQANQQGAKANFSTWSISYIGTLNEFHREYTVRMARLFGRGEAKLISGHLTESDFLRYLNRQIDAAQPLSPFALNTRGIKAYSWSEDDADTLELVGHSSVIEANGNIRYGLPLDMNEDVYRLVAESLTLKECARGNGVRSTVWIGRPDSVDRSFVRSQVA